MSNMSTEKNVNSKIKYKQMQSRTKNLRKFRKSKRIRNSYVIMLKFDWWKDFKFCLEPNNGLHTDFQTDYFNYKYKFAH